MAMVIDEGMPTFLQANIYKAIVDLQSDPLVEWSGLLCREVDFLSEEASACCGAPGAP
jgi:hypothetical protein